MNLESHHVLLENKIKEYQDELVTLEYQFRNLTKPDLETYQQMYKIYLDNLLIHDSITKETFFFLCKQMMDYCTLEEKIKKLKEDLSKLYTMYIDETFPIISKMDLK